MYTQIEEERPPQEIAFDESGVVAFVGTSGTTDVYFAERTDSTTETDGETQTETGTMKFRVIRLRPTFKKGVQPDPRTGVPKYGKELLNCQYAVVSMTVPALNKRATLGRALQTIQEDFRAEMRSPIDTGQVHSNRSLLNIYETHFGGGQST